MLIIETVKDNPRDIKNDTPFSIKPKDINDSTSFFIFALAEDEDGNEITHKIKIENIKAVDFLLAIEPSTSSA
ncbi:MAG: hypothetical protein DRI86_00915 [Bacteroidetes bacterium]|nr:MAG: hypothetical protein DRI86_00915 [Bacteroidota bacterium]